MVFYRDNLGKVHASIKSSPGILYVMAVINMVIGLTVINCYNQWMMDLSVLVALLGWVFLLHGFACLFFPQVVLKQWARSKIFSVRGLIGLIWGILLCWFAFWMQ
jgi:hypothetical protein